MNAGLAVAERCETCSPSLPSVGPLRSISTPRRSSVRPALVPEGFGAWLRGERVDLARHAAGLRPFRTDEFGQNAASPSPAHVRAVNQVLAGFGELLEASLNQLRAAEARAVRGPAAARSAGFTTLAERGQRSVESAETVWNFYFDIFNQRRSRIAGMLLAADRISLDCYQAVYLGMRRARSIPSPPPFAFMQSGQGPATYRRGVAVPRLGQRPNPFPLIMLPYHRLLNPWTLGAVAHEVAHNVQADLGLWRLLPARIEQRLRTHKLNATVIDDWTRWHAEVFSDLLGILLIGPAMVHSLMGVLANSPTRVVRYDRRDRHPPPYLRIQISLAMLRRIGFAAESARLGRIWMGLYPPALARRLPRDLTQSFPLAARAVIDALCFTPLDALGGRAFASAVRFGQKELTITNEAAQRLAAGIDPGIVPARFLIGAARVALDRRFAPPQRIARNFYAALERR